MFLVVILRTLTDHTLRTDAVNMTSCVQAATHSGWTPLIHAAYHGHTEAMKALQIAGASIDETDKIGCVHTSAMPYLHGACRFAGSQWLAVAEITRSYSSVRPVQVWGVRPVHVWGRMSVAVPIVPTASLLGLIDKMR